LTTWTEQLAGGDHAVVMGPRRVPSAPVRNFQALLGDMLDGTASDDEVWRKAEWIAEDEQPEQAV
jgi:hypothetical protein